MTRLPCALLALALLSPAARAEVKFRQTPYYPLQVGNTWRYRAGDKSFQLRVAKHEEVAGTLTARVEMVVDGKVQSFEHVGVTDQGLCRFGFEGKPARPPVCFLKLPPKAGETWTVESKIGDEPLKGTFKIGEDTVKVPAGEYKVVTSSSQDLDANGMKLRFTYYFAENVGMVKQIIEVAGQKVTIELEKFEPAKK